MGAPLPFRIDLFDDEIESLRTFDPDTQLTKEKINRIFLLPAKEIPLDDESIKIFKRKWVERFDEDHRKCSIYSKVNNRIAPQGIEYFLPLFFEECSSIFEYLPKNCLVITENDVESSAQNFWESVKTRFEECNIDSKNPLLSPVEVFIPVSEFFGALKKYPCIKISAIKDNINETAKTFNLKFQPIPDISADNEARSALVKLKNLLASLSGRVLFCAETQGRKEALSKILSSSEIEHLDVDNWKSFTDINEQICLTAYPIERGLYLKKPNILLVTESFLNNSAHLSGLYFSALKRSLNPR